MKKETKTYFVLVVIVILIIFTIFWLKKDPKEVEKDLAKCIGKNSELYLKLGCSACKTQEEIFGKNYNYLNSTDCFYEREKCLNAEIEYTPTWIINEEKIIGVQSIEQLKELTGC